MRRFQQRLFNGAVRQFATRAVPRSKLFWFSGAMITGGVVGGATVFAKVRDQYYNPRNYPKGHVPRPELPFFSINDVKSHSTKDKGMWVTFKGGVYDMTDFWAGHPGGNGRLAMAGGNDLSIYWDIYRMHYQEHVLNFIEKFRIGNLSPDDALRMESEFVFADPYAQDPPRPNPDFLHTLERPFCGEALLKRLGESFYTPNDLHYVRLHMPVANFDKPEDWNVTIKGLGVKETKFTLKDLQTKFQPHTLSCTLQCAGNRRQDFQDRDGKEVFISPQWRVAALSNAKYTGCYVRDVLKSCGLDVDALHYAEWPNAALRFVHYEGYDVTEDGVTYGISIPIEKAVDPRGDCMFVWEMNGEPLPIDHGAPCRTLTPGHVGNKSCKFVEKVTVSTVESPKPWHAKSYRNFPPDVTFPDHLCKWDKLSEDQLSKGPICQWMPVQSFITQPAPGDIIGGKGAKSIKVLGVAWTGNGVGMARVDVSIDGGENFTAADFLPKPADVVKRETWQRKWTWEIFEKAVKIPEAQMKLLKQGKKTELDCVSKGVDNMFNTQPSEVTPYFNARGVVVNNWYHVPVTLDPSKPEGSVQCVTGDDRLNPPTGGHFFKGWHEHGWTSQIAGWHADVLAEAKQRGFC